MKKLHLLKPDVKSCFLNEGRGEKVNYIHIDDTLTAECLAKDVAAGAKQLEDLKALVDKTGGNMSRTVMLRGDNDENLYLAATYLAAVCNEKVGLNGSMDDEELFDDEADDFFEAYEEDDVEEPEEWYESPFKLPMIELDDLQRADSGDSFSSFGNDFMSIGMQQNQNRKPYWMSCRKEPVAIIIREHGYYGGDFARALERFQNNRQIYLLVLEESKSSPFFKRETGEDDEESMDMVNYWEQHILQLVLETTADLASVKKEEKELEEYRVLQLENWVESMGMSLAPKFPKKEITKRITKLRDRKKSALIEKVLKYIKKERRKECTVPLSPEEFDILRQFQSISDKDPDAKGGTYLKQMETELVGMEQVKLQVKNLVQTMKYGKYREKMGLGKSNFHNVHLLLGAPGTAKTTIAKLMGNLMCAEGLLPDNRFICVNGADLKGKYVGHSAPKTKALFKQYDIIVIDEAYSLTAGDRGGMDSFSQEALAQLMIELEEHAEDKLVLFAGYGGTGVAEKDNKMKEFLDANPGLKSRINTTIFFDSYSPKEMVQIVRCQAGLQKFNVEEGADAVIQEYFAERVKAEDFGNGREARSLLENAIISAAARIMELPEKKRTKKMLQELTTEDMQNAVARLRGGNQLQRGRERKLCGF